VIQFLHDRLAVCCDTCGRAVARPADGLVVRWASSSALVVHRGDCLAELRVQYPSTTTTPPIELADALEQLAAQAPRDNATEHDAGS
jgi:hypothetical protein